MSFLEKIRPNSGGRNTHSNSAESFFGVVKSIHPNETVPFVVLSLIGSEEERRVALNPQSQIECKEGYERPGIANLTKGKMRTEIGGTVRIESAYLDRNSGTWMARWLSTALKSPDQGVVRVFPEARVGALVPVEGGKPYRTLDILYSQSAVPVRSLDELDTAIASAIEARNGAFVRIRDSDTPDGKPQYDGMFVSGGKPDAPLDQRIERALSADIPNLKLLREELAKGDLPNTAVIEVVPMQRTFFGAESATQKSLDVLFVGKGDGDRTYSKGFTEVLATYHYYEGSSGDVMCVGAIPKAPFPQFSRVGASFESSVPAGPESVESAEAGASGASQAPADDLPPEMDLEDAMSAGVPSVPGRVGPSF